MIKAKHFFRFIFVVLFAFLFYLSIAAIPAVLQQWFEGQALHIPTFAEILHEFLEPELPELLGGFKVVLYVVALIYGYIAGVAGVFLTIAILPFTYFCAQDCKEEEDKVGCDNLLQAINCKRLDALAKLLRIEDRRPSDIVKAAKVFTPYNYDPEGLNFQKGTDLLLEEVELQLSLQKPLPLTGSWDSNSNHKELKSLMIVIQSLKDRVNESGVYEIYGKI